MCIRSVSNRLALLCRIFPPHVGLPPHISQFLLFGTPCSTGFAEHGYF
jgi:hypothetical protein